MHKPTDLIEYETMLLGRHSLATRRSRREGGLLERSAYILLSRIRIEGPMSIRQLSEAFDLDPSTLNRQTSAMLRDGLVERIPDPAGGIARKFRITAEGERRLDSERGQITAGIDKIMSDWTAEEVEAFASFLQRFNTDIERLAGSPWPRP
ncbi:MULTISPECIES: MarR family winged helix-turn-helix transcriptional regulator [Actinomadura]|jgi:DNA-binding MarR family transcriptional regulator|uniref:DNA-binding MarR family transcriptional regulator n=1 Tax=Actinomadura citrea TaxID=46158 RepID=A0A7Y9KF54_9ACTN|nr:MarR family transcriptional regulator [Actinomadura citrea]NYE15111.1 DNA-binding MarR family transcriptional regulator [Actinomadura citrea]GGT85405.1 transcriptional regulator [Actinomadura citrea]